MSPIREFMDGLWAGVMRYGELNSVVVNSALLLFVYVIGVGLTSLLGKAAGMRFLTKGRKSGTYWVPLHLGTKSKDAYYRQY